MNRRTDRHTTEGEVDPVCQESDKNHFKFKYSDRLRQCANLHKFVCNRNSVSRNLLHPKLNGFPILTLCAELTTFPHSLWPMEVTVLVGRYAKLYRYLLSIFVKFSPCYSATTTTTKTRLKIVHIKTGTLRRWQMRCKTLLFIERSEIAFVLCRLRGAGQLFPWTNSERRHVSLKKVPVQTLVFGDFFFVLNGNWEIKFNEILTVIDEVSHCTLTKFSRLLATVFSTGTDRPLIIWLKQNSISIY